MTPEADRIGNDYWCRETNQEWCLASFQAKRYINEPNSYRNEKAKGDGGDKEKGDRGEREMEEGKKVRR